MAVTTTALDTLSPGWSVSAVGPQQAAPQIQGTGINGSLTLTPRFEDGTPAIYQFTDVQVGPNDAASGFGLAFNLDLAISNASGVTFNNMIVDLILPYNNENPTPGAHPTYAHFHPNQNPSNALFTQDGYKVDYTETTQTLTPRDFNSGNRVVLGGNAVETGAIESWNGGRIHQFDQTFFMIAEPLAEPSFASASGVDLRTLTHTLKTEHFNPEVMGTVGNDLLLGSDASNNIIRGQSGHDLIIGLEGDDLTEGGDGVDRLFGGAGADTLNGDSGQDWMEGGADSDLLNAGVEADFADGNAGADTLRGDFGSDTLNGGGNHDLIYGNQNTDSITGGDGNDTLFGGQNDGPAGADGVLRQGIDTALGGAGDDMIYGNHGPDALTGEAGRDVMFGGQDNDTIMAGDGADVLYGNRGDDTLIGGSDADLYVFAGSSGNDRIEDFNAAEGDRLQLEGVSFTLGTGASGAAMLDLGNGNSITLAGVAQDAFDSSWIVG